MGYRANRHFQSAQFAAMDSDTGDQRSTIDHYLADPFFKAYGGLIYTTLSHAADVPKCRPVFVSAEPYTDAGRYRALKVGLMHRYPWTDAAVKDPSRLFYGSKPGSGQVVVLGNVLPPEVCEELEEVGRPPERSTTPSTPTQPLGRTPAARYVNTAVASITGRLAAASVGVGDRYPQIIPAALKLRGLKLAPWLPQDLRDGIDVYGLVLGACGTNGALAHYGEDHLRRAIDWAVARADPAQEPRQRRAANGHRPRQITNWEVRV